MKDHVEELSMEDLQGLYQPEDYLFGDDGPPDLHTPIIADPEKGLGLRRLRGRGQQAVIPQPARPDGHEPDPFARDLTPLDDFEFAQIQQQLQKQPVLYQEVQKLQTRGEVSRVFGMLLAVILTLAFFVRNAWPDKGERAGGYFRSLEDLHPAKAPNLIRDILPSGLENALADAVNKLPHDTLTAAHIAAAAALPFMMLLTLGYIFVTTFRIALLRRVQLVFPLLVSIWAFSIVWSAFHTNVDHLNAYNLLFNSIVLLLLVRPVEKLSNWIATQIRRQLEVRR